MKIIAFGEILWDIIEGEEHLGGAPFNFVAHSAQCGNRSLIISRLGTDYLGMRAFNKCKVYEVGQDFIQWDEEYPTGTVNVKLTNGQPDYVIHEGVAYDFIQAKQIKSESPLACDVFYFGSLAQRNEVSATSLQKILSTLDSKYIFYDVNLRKDGYNESIVRASLKACNVFKLNTDELPVISHMLAAEVLGRESFIRCLTSLFPNIQTVIITAAEKGCFVFDVGTGLSHIPGVPVAVADAVGAGDAFSAAFMHVLATYSDPIAAGKVANHIGAFVASKTGAIPQYPKEISNLLKGNFKMLDQLAS